MGHEQRFPLLAMVPFTGLPAPVALYSRLVPGVNGLTMPSIDNPCFPRRYGLVSDPVLAAFAGGLCL